MKWTRRDFAGLAFPSALALSAAPRPAAGELSPGRVHAELTAGNHRFVTGKVRHPHSSLKWAKRMESEGQHPHATVLCCSDSRVSPEIIFDQGLGDLFVVRVAGNVLREDEIGSLEYAVEHLGVPLCVILGHTGCGAVNAVVSHEDVPPEVAHLVSPIQAAYDEVRQTNPQFGAAALMDATTRLHVRQSRRRLEHASAFFEDRIGRKRLRVESAVYHLTTGRVEWI